MSGASAEAGAAPGQGPGQAPEPRTPRQGRPRTLSCPNCGGTIQVRAAGISISAACASCGAVVDVASEELRIIGEAHQRTRQPGIPIGARGELAGTAWEVVGYQVRSNPQEGWSWEEYLLFSPYYGFRFLARDDEGWTLYCMLRRAVPHPEQGVGDGRRYELKTLGAARTDYVLGEFYWRVRVGDTVATSEYRAQPYLLVQEESPQETTWSRGVTVAEATVRRAFGLQPGLGVQTEDPAEARARTRGILAVAAAAVLLLVLLHAVPFGRHRAETVFTQLFLSPAASRQQTVATEPFTVPDSSGNLRVLVQTPIIDGRMRLLLSLVSTAAVGPRTFDADRSIESYTGVPTGTEPVLHEANAVFASVPGGEYRLLVDADVQAGLDDAGEDVPYVITVQRHVPAPELFWLGLAGLLAYPLCHVVARLWRGTLVRRA